MSSPFFSFFSLGGIGEIGLNSYVFDFGKESVIVDMGISFPDNNNYGVGVILPDLSHIKNVVSPVKGIIFTHGHEDHTGAYPYYKESFDAPVYAPPFAVELMNLKLAEFSKESIKNPILIEGKKKSVSICGRTFTFFKTRHSIPQSYGFCFDTPWGCCIFTSDFKTIPDIGSLPEKPFMLFADSSNVETEEDVDEREIDKTFDRIFRSAEGAVIATTFSSHIQRIGKIINIAERYGRKIFVVGRNLINAVEISKKLELLPPFTIHEWEDIHKTPRNEMVIITTGTQGEKFSSLNLIAQGNFRGFKVQKGDAVIVSSRIIPGNERNIYGMLNRLSEREAIVYYSKTSSTHTSGHGSKKDITELLKTLKPQYVVPVHGEHRHLLAYREIAVKSGMSEDSIFILKNGAVIQTRDGAPVKAGEHKTGRIFIDSKNPHVISVDTIKERKKLAEDGVITATIDALSRCVANMEIIGVTDEPEFKDALSERIEEHLGLYLTGEETDYPGLKESVTQAIKIFTKKRLAKKPVVIACIVEGKCY